MAQKFRKISWIVLFFIVMGVILPVYYAYAYEIPGWPDSAWDLLKMSFYLNPITGIPLASFEIIKSGFGFEGGEGGGIGGFLLEAIVGGGFSFLILITAPILTICQGFLHWVTSPDFINVSFINNPVVNIGWDIVRDFTNMFIVLGFTLVALATILRRQEYQAQKLLPLLIGIALLINFTPVICGFIIDISNVTMNYFLTAGTLDRSLTDTIVFQTESLLGAKDVGLSQRFMTGVVLVAFNLIASVIFLLFALLFAVRYVALWILVILSPLAFFCYILPATKKVWSMWWQQFIQWCIVGIPAAFFIYLSNIMIREMAQGNLTSKAGGDLTAFVALFQFSVPLLFLIIGFFATLQTSAIGADKIMGLATSNAGKVGKWTKEKGWKAIEGTKTSQKIGELGGKMQEKLRLKRPGEYRMETEKKREEMRKDMERYTKEERTQIRERRTTPYQEKIAAKQVALEKGEIEDTKDEKRIEERIISELQSAGANLSGTFEKRPDLIVGKVSDSKPDETPAQATSRAIQKQVNKTSRLKFRQETKPKALNNKDVFAAMSGEQMEEIKLRGTVEQRKALQENVIKNQTEMKGEVERLRRESAQAAVLASGGVRKKADEAREKAQRAERIDKNLNTIIRDPNFA